ncbi:MAG: tetratricopeptide repeat protein [Nitrospiria bacterium]
METTGAKPIKNRSPKELTPKQKKFLQEQYRLLSDKELARSLHSDKTSVRNALEALGLKREEGNPLTTVPLRFHLIAVLFLFFSVFLAYGHTLNYAFHFDDLKTFVENPSLHIKELSWANISPVLHANRPVANLTYALNFYFDRLETRGYHLVNILIHFMTAVIIYFIFLRTLSLPGLEEPFARITVYRGQISLLGALLWAVHPVQTQAVTYVVQRMASLAALFYLLSLLAYINGRLSRGKEFWGWLALSALSAGLAFGTKENTLTLPFVIGLYDLFLISRFKIHFSLRYRVILVILLAGLFIGFSWIYRMYGTTGGLLSMLSANYGTEEMDPWLRTMTEWRVIVLYMMLLLFPYPGRMSLDYDFPMSRSLFDPMTTFLSLCVILGLIGFALFNARKRPLISFSILWFFINLAIESTFIKLDLVFEHRLYLPSVMLFLLFSAGIYLLALRYQIRRQEVVLTTAIILISVLLFMTHERNKVWRSSVSLWSDTALKAPNKSRVINNLGKAYLEEEQWERAKSKFAEAIRLNPKNQEALNNLGNAYQRDGNYAAAIKYYQDVLELNPNNPLGHNDLGVAYQALGKSDLALREFREAVRLDPDYTDAHNNLGNIYLLSNQLDLAAVEYQKTIDLNPKHPMAHTNLGVLYQKQGKVKEAVNELRIGLSLNPRSAIAQFNYGYLLDTMGQKNEAIAHYEEAIKWAAPQDAAQIELVKQRLKNLKG